VCEVTRDLTERRMPPYRSKSSQQLANLEKPQDLMEKYLKEFRVDQCPLFLQHKCQQHRPFTCFNWHFQVKPLSIHCHPLFTFFFSESETETAS
jgi:hypothetical protein